MEVTFKVDGEWLTNFFRIRFWEEKCGFDKAIQIIKKSLCADITDAICIELLEGRKKLIGINEFELIDDNENIRPMAIYIKEQEQKNIQNQIARNIETYPYNYIDQYACTTSRAWMKPYEYEFKGIGWWYEKLVYERGNSYDTLLNGCTWLENVDNTAKMLANHTDKNNLTHMEFADIVFKEYELTIELLREKEIPFNELSDYYQSIICRNRHYALLNKRNWNYLNEEKFTTKMHIAKLENEKAKQLKIENEKTHREEFVNRFIETPISSNPIDSFISMLSESEPFDTCPAIPISGWDGFIDREGNFYKTKPIGKGWYNGSANCHSEWAYQYLKEQNIKLDNDCRDAKDYLIHKLGWCDMSHFVLVSKEVNVNKPRKGFTREQEKTLFTLFLLNNDPMNKYYDLLDIKE